MLSNKKIRALYGESVVLSRKGSFTLVHLDKPSRATIRKRAREFDPDDFFCPECPLCQQLKEDGIVVFDDSFFEEDQGSK